MTDAKQIRVRLEVRTNQTHVTGVTALLGTALYNFSINSVATLDDPAIAVRKVMIRIAAKTPQTTAVQVFDNGCGLPESIRDRPSSLLSHNTLGWQRIGTGDRGRHRALASRQRFLPLKATSDVMEMVLPNE